MVLLGAQSVLQISPPPVEELLGLGIESQERPLLRCQVLSAHRARLERVQPLEDLHRARPGRPVRPPIHVPPGPGAVGPHGELKPLDQPIIPAAAEDLAHVPLERPGLEAAEHREARGLGLTRRAITYRGFAASPVASGTHQATGPDVSGLTRVRSESPTKPTKW